MRLASLHLHNFRNFETLRLDDGQPAMVLVGPNGAGKTNILEAISLLAPGRGLRNAALPQILRQGADERMGWGVQAQIENGLPIATGWKTGMSKRALTIGADDKAKQKDLAESVNAIWLVPSMDRMVAEAPAGRRRFIDRLVFALDPAHAGRVTRYEKAVTERLRLLKEGRAQASWLEGLELDAASTGASIAAHRVAWLHKIKPYLASSVTAGFPQPDIELHGFMEAGLTSGTPAVMLERQMAEALNAARKTDAQNGTCSVGPHRTDVHIHYAQKNQDSRLASTGEQKALLISLILAQTNMLSHERGLKPLLLLDDIASHLDDERRKSLFETLLDYANSGGQIWLTGADENALRTLENRAFFVAVGTPPV